MITKPSTTAVWVADRLLPLGRDRAALASLRSFAAGRPGPGTYSLLARIGALGDSFSARHRADLAGLFAFQPQNDESMSPGEAFRILGLQSDRTKINPSFERRFEHLLSATPQELFRRLRPFVLRARAQQVALPWVRIGADTQWWNARTKREWAVDFWSSVAAPDSSDESPTADEEDVT